MLGAAVNYGECACDPPEGTWGFPIVIQMNGVLYSSNIVPVYACL